MRKKQSLLGTLVFAILFFVGGFAAYKYITQPMAREAAETKAWPSTEGVITFSELSKSKNSDGKDMYSANVQYSYSVDGREYSDDNISTVDGSTSMKSSVKKKLRKYVKGKDVTVYYDPEFPNTAVLEPGTSLVFGLLLRLPLLFCAVAVLMVLGFLKRFLTM